MRAIVRLYMTLEIIVFLFHSPVGPVEGTYGDEEEQLHTEEKSFQHRTGVGDETIEWSSREEDAKDQEKVLKPISKECP